MPSLCAKAKTLQREVYPLLVMTLTAHQPVVFSPLRAPVNLVVIGLLFWNGLQIRIAISG